MLKLKGKKLSPWDRITTHKVNKKTMKYNFKNNIVLN